MHILCYYIIIIIIIIIIMGVTILTEACLIYC